VGENPLTPVFVVLYGVTAVWGLLSFIALILYLRWHVDHDPPTMTHRQAPRLIAHA
jgi:hypothetical protein